MKRILLTLALLLIAAQAQAQTCTRVSSTAQNCVFSLSWQAPAVDANHDPATSYIVQRKIGAGAFADLATVNTLTYQDTLNNDPGNTSVTYQVVSANSAGRDGPSNAVTKTTPAIAPTIPNPPSGLQVSALTSSQIVLTWNDNSTNESYFQARVKQSNLPLPQFAANTTTGTVGGFQPNKNYDVQIAAGNAAGLSAYTPYVRVRTPK